MKELKALNLSKEEFDARAKKFIQKSCLCEDLAAPGFINSEIPEEEKPFAVAVCPGPNLAYFTKLATLEQMIGHIYGRFQLLGHVDRPNMFINELKLYVEYLKKDIEERLDLTLEKNRKYIETFKTNLAGGIEYYKTLIPKMMLETDRYKEKMLQDLHQLERQLMELMIPSLEFAS